MTATIHLESGSSLPISICHAFGIDHSGRVGFCRGWPYESNSPYKRAMLGPKMLSRTGSESNDLRHEMASLGKGAWLSTALSVNSEGIPDSRFNYDDEPAWFAPLEDAAYVIRTYDDFGHSCRFDYRGDPGVRDCCLWRCHCCCGRPVGHVDVADLRSCKSPAARDGRSDRSRARRHVIDGNHHSSDAPNTDRRPPTVAGQKRKSGRHNAYGNIVYRDESAGG
ncbi:Uncharacterised protein [Mycobacteroides abscessus subsp. massiliense]|nr:Uncharacterised protein [Mycobacteroides abscessus subsp. massiliense]SKU07702.1 Uncharacterised protein [Mycobacteroides abscessus subsp. massiliense]